MNKEQPIEVIRRDRIVPVVVIDDASLALPLAQALSAGGLGNIEITLRTPAGIEAVRAVAAETELCVGAGTVLSVEQAKKATDAGASFLVSPGMNPDVIAYCQDNGIVIIPGVCTPTEVEQAMAFGLRTLKFFPAEAAGGAGFLKAISAPYQDVTFVPTGGISDENFLDYAARPAVLACGASWIVEKSLINAGNWPEITHRCAAFKMLLSDNKL